MRNFILGFFIFCSIQGYSQSSKNKFPNANIRLSFLLYPFTPLLSFEVKTIEKLTLQLESNFVNTHGPNLKYYLSSRMEGQYLFTGLALVENKLLRADNKITFLPYIGYGYAQQIGNKKRWTFDNRIGIGATTNADNNGIYPILKTGFGRKF